MPRFVRFLGVVLLFAAIFIPKDLLAQCVGLPTVQVLASSKIPQGFCAPVQANFTYDVTFLNAVPTGTLELVIDWGDGTAPQVFPQTANSAVKAYHAAPSHNFPLDSDCEFLVVMTMRYNGVLCLNTRQQQKIASWRTDEFNGGNVQLISPVTGNNEHLVCYGQPVSVIFDDQTEFNCASDYTHLGSVIETPNTEIRWQQIIYNTPIGGSKIPNVSVNGVAVTGNAGADILANYGDPRGVLNMPAPVVINDPRRRDALPITAPGGFGAGFPQVGDVFEVTIRYWNFCNPYTENPDPTKPPLNGDLQNGDNPPVERTAIIRIVDSPPAPTGSDQTVCSGTTPSDFSMTIPGGGNNIVNWYRDNAGVPGTKITSGPSTTLPITSHPNWVNNTTPGIYRVWASYQPNVVGPSACESPRVLVSRTIREPLTVPDPVPAFPTEVCNGTAASPVSVTISLPAPVTNPIGGATEYTFTGSGGVTLTGNTATTATFNINAGFAPGTLFIDRTVRVERHYTPGAGCPAIRSFPLRIYNRPVGGTATPIPDVCETTPLSTIVLNGYLGDIVRWEESKNGGAFATYTGPASGATISPGTRTPGVYRFRAVVNNGPCTEVFSTVVTVTVSSSPVADVTVGPDQTFCGPLTSTPMLGTPTGGVGVGTWTYVSSFPNGRPAPTISDIHDENATITVTLGNEGAYTMRWTIANGICTDYDEIVVDFGSTPTTSNAGIPQDICGETTTLGANTPVIGFGSWTILSNPSGAGDPGTGVIEIDDPTSPTSDLTLTGPTFRYGTYRLQWQIKSGSCPVSLSTVDITFHQPATATATDIGPICIGPTAFAAIPLSGTIGGGATGGQWVNVNGAGTVSASTVSGTTVTATYTPAQADYNAGTPIRVKLVANANAPCVAVEQEILINIDRTPLVNAGTNITNICGDAVQLNAENPPPFGATGQWTTTQAGVTFDDPTNPVTFVHGLPAAPLPNTTVVTWKLTSASGLCPSAPVSINLTRVSPPAASNQVFTECEIIPAGAPVVTNIVLNNYQAAILAASGGSSITWYKNSTPETGGTLIPNPALVQTNIADGQIYIARVTGGSGCSADVTVTIRVRPLPTALDKDVALCEDVIGSNTATGVDLSQPSFITAITGGATGVTVAWFDNQADAAAGTSPITAPFDVTGSRTVYGRVTYNTTPSCSDIGEIKLAVKNLPTNAEIFGRDFVCMGDPTVDPNDLPTELYQVTAVSGATYHWVIPTGPGQFRVFGGGTLNDAFVLLQFPNQIPAGLTIKAQVEINGCPGPVIEKLITVNPTPVNPIIVGPDIVCENDNGIQYTIQNTNFPASSYNWEIRKVSDNTIGGAFVADGQTTDRVLITFQKEDVVVTVRESNSICVSDVVSKTVTLNKRPIIKNTDIDVCSDSPSGLIFIADPASPVPIDKFDVSLSGTVPLDLTPITGPTTGTGMAANAIANDTYENLSAVFQQINYSVQPISVGAGGKECPGAPEIITLNIKPEPQLDPNLDRSICSGDATNIILVSASNTFPADKFYIEGITVPPGVTPLTPIQTPSPVTQYDAFALRDHKWENTTGVNQQVSYDIRPFSTLIGCSGNPPSTVNVTIYPKTVVDPVGVIEVCSGEPINIPFKSTINPAPTGPDFIWSVRSFDPFITITGPSTGTGNITGLIAENTSLASDGTITFEVQGKNIASEGGCLGPVLTFTVTILKAPKANALDLVACSDAVSGTTATVNLRNLETSVAGADPVPADITIKWYTDITLATQIAPANLNAYVVQNGIPVYALVTYVPTGCTKAVPVRHTVNPGVGIAVTVNNVDCAGANDGEITVNLTGGTPSFSYSIDGGGFITVPASTYAFTLIPGGTTHTIDVKDSKGCTATKTNVTVTSPPPLAAAPVLTNITCFLGTDGKIEVHASGGTGTYTEFRILQTGFVDPDNDGVFTGLPFGTYTVRITDSNNCTLDVQADLTQPTQVELTNISVGTDANGNNLSCRDAQDGSIKLEVDGGTPDVSTGFPTYRYELLNTNNSQFNVNVQGSATEEFSAAVSGHPIGWGTYTIRAYDSRNCPSRPSIVIINNPPPFDPGIIGTSYSVCEGAAPQTIKQLAPPSGGTGDYEYSWEMESSLNLPAGFQPTQQPSAGLLEYTPGDKELPPGPFQTQGVYRFRRIVKTKTDLPNATGCPALGQDRIVTVTVNPTLTASIEKFGSECEGTSGGVTVSLAPLPDTENNVFYVSYRFNNNTETVNDYKGVQKKGDAFGTATITIPSFTTDDTYTLLSVTDPYGCPAAIRPPDHIDIHVIKTPVALSVVDDDQCPDEPFIFNWTPDPAINYTLNFNDSPTIWTYPAGSAPGTVSHTFTGFTTGEKFYLGTLTAQQGVCPAVTSTVQIRVAPAIIVNVTQDDPTLCGGEAMRFTDQTKGASQVHWYYQVAGTTAPLGEYTGSLQPTVIYNLDNTTTNDPVVYEFKYEASNADGCTGTQALTPVKVYRNVTADFAVGPIPEFSAGAAQVTFTNTSIPANAGSGISYHWDFGEVKADPSTIDAWGPHTVKYPTAGHKIITLTVTNETALADGKNCKASIIKPIDINLPPLTAAFTATPLAACFPTEITVVNNSPGADTFYWELDGPGGVVGTSTLINPTFTIQSPGVYTIKMSAAYSLTLDTQPPVDATPKTVQVYANPIAAFDFRPNPVYVPDTELSAFNLSKNADNFSWDFDDGYVTNDVNPKHTYKLEGQYTITLVANKSYGNQDVNGDGVLDGDIVCYDTTRQIVNAVHGGQIKIPNAFTPNPNGSTGGTGTPGNGSFNDVFLPISSGIEEFTMQIFDRWGTLIFESKDKNVGWDGYDRNGRLMTAGVYVYRIVMRLSNGQRTTKIGDVTLIR